MKTKKTKKTNSERLLEMAYLYAWGPDGSYELRQEWHKLNDDLLGLKLVRPYMTWDGDKFHWSTKKPKD